MGHARNATLEARIAELGLSEKELSDLINDAVEVSTGRRGRSTDRYVRLLIDGTIRWPWPANRQALEQILDRGILELGFVPRGRSALRLPKPSTGHTAQGAQEAPMERREMLGIAAGASVSIVVPSLPAQGRIGMTDVERLRAPLDELVTIDQLLGGVALAPVCARQAERVLDVARRCEASDRVERAMYRLAGEYLARAGWSAVDADDMDAADGYLNRALRAANTAQDPMLQAEITNVSVMRARQAGDFQQAHVTAKTGLNSTAARHNPKLTALFHARVAHGHAYRGESGMAQRSIGRAQEALDRATPDTPTPSWLLFLNRAELASQAAMTYHTLGRYTQAARQAEHARDAVLPGYVRNRTLYVLDLADARLGEREVEQAAAQAGVALELAGQLRGGARCGRVGRRLRQLRMRFSHWREVSEARTWVETYDAALATAPRR